MPRPRDSPNELAPEPARGGLVGSAAGGNGEGDGDGEEEEEEGEEVEEEGLPPNERGDDQRKVVAEAPAPASASAASSTTPA